MAGRRSAPASAKGIGPLAIAVVAALLAGCGSSDESKTSDQKIVDALNLQERNGGYTIGDNLLCGVSDLLNDAGEVDALSKAQTKVAIVSRSGDAGILVVTPFAPTCEQDAQKALNKLDRKAAD